MPVLINGGKLLKDCPSLFQIINERSDQIFKHNRTVEKDVLLNTEDQLIYAAITILCGDTVTALIPPKGWDEKIWQHIIEKPTKEQLIIAATFIAAEYDRQTYIENQNK